ncbi:MAG: hypothetical protein PHU40_11300 [Sulfurimonas sp.]|nr:hypothetical protein [Sulfurimonas sp.]
MIYLLIIIGLILLALVVNKAYKNTNFYKNKFVDTYKFKNIPQNLEVVNLGSNQPKFAFDYSQNDVLGMSWAVGPQTLEYDFRILKNYYSYLKKDAKVIIALSPFQFFLDKYKDDAANHKYYEFLEPSLIDGYSQIKKRLHIDFPIFTAKKQILRILKDVPADKRVELGINPLNAEKIKKDAQKWVDGWKKQFGINTLENIELSDGNKTNIDKNIKLLKEMIAFCKEREYEAVLLVLPVTKELSSLFPDEFVEKYILNPIKEANEQNVKFLNYWRDERFEAEENYIDSFFMNKVGRNKFTKQVLEDLS